MNQYYVTGKCKKSGIIVGTYLMTYQKARKMKTTMKKTCKDVVIVKEPK